MRMVALLLIVPADELRRLLLDGFQSRGTVLEFSELRHTCLVLLVKGKCSRHHSVLYKFAFKTKSIIPPAAVRV